MTDLEEKRERVFARIQARRNKREHEKVEQNHDGGTFKLEDFSQHFSEQHAAILKSLRNVTTQSTLDSLNKEFDDLRAFLAKCAAFLPDRDAGRAQNELQQLQTRMNEREDAIKPKKKFAFSSKKKQSLGPKAEVDINCAGDHKKTIDNGVHAEMKMRADCTVEDLEDLKLTVLKEECKNKDVLLRNLTNCTVKVDGNASTVHIIGVNKSTVILKPVVTSVFVDKCTDCTLVAGCQQLRMHTSKKCDLYLHVTSTAIIEDCSEIRVAPYCLKDAQIWISEIGLKDINNWDKINDFNWLSNEQSPNWKVLSVEEREEFEI